uniref:Uncharacterized protein n=1 Tax=Caenorhabditis japonica TaxID=281687 RepID=A0A8R1DLK3_CAEJA
MHYTGRQTIYKLHANREEENRDLSTICKKCIVDIWSEFSNDRRPDSQKWHAVTKTNGKYDQQAASNDGRQRKESKD